MKTKKILLKADSGKWFENAQRQCYNIQAMNDVEKTVLKNCAELNENVTIFSSVDDRVDVYKSRFLELSLSHKNLIIDEPSPENRDAALIMKNQKLECFFEYKSFRYLFDTRVLDHVDYLLNEQRIHALKISLPDMLSDGERREYFRVEVSPRQPVSARFLLFKRAAAAPEMSAILKGEPYWFDGLVHDVSGAGLCLYSKDKATDLALEKGDRLELFFCLKPGGEEMHLWAEVRNVRRIENLGVHAWGVRFLETKLNPNLKKSRNLLMRYVVERQREIISR